MVAAGSWFPNGTSNGWRLGCPSCPTGAPETSSRLADWLLMDRWSNSSTIIGYFQLFIDQWSIVYMYVHIYTQTIPSKHLISDTIAHVRGHVADGSYLGSKLSRPRAVTGPAVCLGPAARIRRAAGLARRGAPVGQRAWAARLLPLDSARSNLRSNGVLR